MNDRIVIVDNFFNNFNLLEEHFKKISIYTLDEFVKRIIFNNIKIVILDNNLLFIFLFYLRKVITKNIQLKWIKVTQLKHLF